MAKKVFLFEVNVKGNCIHYQALYASLKGAEKAEKEYRKQCKVDLMDFDIHELEIHGFLGFFTWIRRRWKNRNKNKVGD